MAVRSAGAAKAPVAHSEYIYPKEWPKIEERLLKRPNVFIYGDEPFSIEDAASRSAATVKKTAQSDIGSASMKHVDLGDDNFDMNEFFESENTIGLFGGADYKVQMVRGLSELGATSAQNKQFCAYINSLSKDSGASEKCVIIVYGAKRITAEVSRSIKDFMIINCKKLYEADINGYVKNLAARTGKNFTDDAIAEIIERSRMNLFKINSELKRLAVLNFEHAEIGRDSVEKYVEHFFDPDSFQAINELDYAIYTKDLKNSIAIIGELIDKGVYYSIVVSRLMSIFRTMLNATLLKEASEAFARNGFKIAAEYAEGMARKSGYERFRFSTDTIAKYENFCGALVNSTGLYRSDSKYDILNASKSQMTLYAIYYSKNYGEASLFRLMRSLYMIDVKIRTGQLRVDQRTDSVKEEIFRILMAND